MYRGSSSESSYVGQKSGGINERARFFENVKEEIRDDLKASLKVWNCQQCTFQNSLDCSSCSICGEVNNSIKSKFLSCSVCTLENPLQYTNCSACGSKLQESKENILNGTIVHAFHQNQGAPSVTSRPVKSETVLQSIKTENKGSNFSKSSFLNLVDLCAENDVKDEEELDNRSESESPEGESEDGSLGSYTYGEDETYASESEEEDELVDTESDESIDEDEMSEEEDYNDECSSLRIGRQKSSSANAVDEGDLCNTLPAKERLKTKANQRSRIIAIEDIDEFESESELSMRHFFQNEDLPGKLTVSSSSKKKQLQQLLGNQPREAPPTYPNITAHYWSVKSLAVKGICSIDFNDFTLDKGASNPNSQTPFQKKVKNNQHSQSRTSQINARYEETRRKREEKVKNKSHQEMVTRLHTSGTLVDNTATRRERKTRKNKTRTKERQKKTKIKTKATKKAKTSTKAKTESKKRKASSNETTGEWIETNHLRKRTKTEKSLPVVRVKPEKAQTVKSEPRINPERKSEPFKAFPVKFEKSSAFFS